MKKVQKKLFGVERPLAVWVITFFGALFSIYLFLGDDVTLAMYTMLWVNFIFMWKWD